MTDDGVRPSTVLVVCTANVCRSPLAERTLQHAFAGSAALAGFTVSSAGTFAQQGAPMCALSATQLDGDDGEWAEAHQARQLTPELVAASDLILTMEREQRSIASRLVPGSQAKVFTITEAAVLAELLVADPRADPVAGSITSIAAGLHGKRGYAPPSTVARRRWGRRVEPADHLTIEDGHGRSERLHLQAVQATRSTTVRLAAALEHLTGPERRAGPPRMSPGDPSA